MGLIDHAAHQVPLRDVGGFVRHDAGELVLIACGQKQARIDGNEPAGHGECVDHRIAHHEIIELMLPFLGVAGERVADGLDVVAHLRILEHHALRAHLPGPGLSDLILLLERDRRGRGTAEVGQLLFLFGWRQRLGRR